MNIDMNIGSSAIPFYSLRISLHSTTIQQRISLYKYWTCYCWCPCPPLLWLAENMLSSWMV